MCFVPVCMPGLCARGTEGEKGLGGVWVSVCAAEPQSGSSPPSSRTPFDIERQLLQNRCTRDHFASHVVNAECHMLPLPHFIDYFTPQKKARLWQGNGLKAGLGDT